MSKLGRISRGAAALIALWAIGLGVAGFALAGRTRDQVADRLAESLQAKVTVDDASLSLLRGRFALGRLAARRDDGIGHLAIEIADVTCALPPLGAALFDRTCSELALRGVRLEVSTAALFQLRHPKRPPLHARRVVIDDARLELAASALVPSLGKVVLQIEHAEAGDTVFKTPLSWLFALRALRARIELPGELTILASYGNGELRVSGGIFGSTPIALPFAVPVASLAEDPKAELARLVGLGKELVEKLIAARAAAWIESKLGG